MELCPPPLRNERLLSARRSAILGTMKKLTLAAAVLSLSIAAPAFACPQDQAAPSTAETAKAPATKTAKAKAKPAEKAKTEKTADKVSQR
jgi:hypothetical protein